MAAQAHVFVSVFGAEAAAEEPRARSESVTSSRHSSRESGDGAPAQVAGAHSGRQGRARSESVTSSSHSSHRNEAGAGLPAQVAEPWMCTVAPESERVLWPLRTLATELATKVLGNARAVVAHETASVVAGTSASASVDPAELRITTGIDALKLSAPWGSLEAIITKLPANERMKFCKPGGRKSHMGRGRRSTWRLCKLEVLDAWLYVSGAGAMAVQQVVAAICSTWSSGLAEGKGYRLQANEVLKASDGAGGRPRGSVGFIYNDPGSACGTAKAATWLRRLLGIPTPPDARLRLHIIGTGQDADIGNGAGGTWKLMEQWHADAKLRAHGSCAVCVECTLDGSDDGLFLDARSPIVTGTGVDTWPSFGLARLVNVNGRVVHRDHVRATLYGMASKLNWYSGTVMLFKRRTSPAAALRDSCASGIGSESTLRKAVSKYIAAMASSTTANRVRRVPLRLEQTVSMKALMDATNSLRRNSLRSLEACVAALAQELVMRVWPAVVRVPASDLHAWVASDNARTALTLDKVLECSVVPVGQKVAAVRAVAAIQLFKHDGGLDPVDHRSAQARLVDVRVLERAHFAPHQQRVLGQESGWWEPRKSVLDIMTSADTDDELEDADMQQHRAAPTKHGGECHHERCIAMRCGCGVRTCLPCGVL